MTSGHESTDVVVDFTALLLDTLGFTDDEFVSIGHEAANGAFPSAVGTPARAPDYVDKLPTANIFFGVNPTKGPARRNARRGTEADVTRLAVLCCDLDVKPGACASLDVAHAIIANLGIILGTRPTVVVSSGHGLQPYWPIEDGHIANGDIIAARALVHRFGRLVVAVAGDLNVKVDNVYDLARMLRIPGTYNCKTSGNGDQPILVVAHTDTGGPLTMSEVDERLTEVGIDETDDDREAARKELSPPAGWVWAAEHTCGYAATIIDGLASDGPKPGGGRNPWACNQAVRLCCAQRLGCLTEGDYRRAEKLLTERLTALLGSTEPRRTLRRLEMRDIFALGRKRASEKTDEQCRSELGDHEHDSVNDDPPPEPDDTGPPERYTGRKGLLTLKLACRS